MNAFLTYLNSLARINRLGGGKPLKWFFHAGMLFSTRNKWWGDFKFRATVHEGVDIAYYTDAHGNFHQFDPDIIVPVMADCRILKICDDFLGRSIITEPLYTKTAIGFRILYVYAHITPHDHVRVNDEIRAQEPVAFVSPTHKNPLLPPHLHFSVFEIPAEIPVQTLDWSFFSKSDQVRLIHPWFL